MTDGSPSEQGRRRSGTIGRRALLSGHLVLMTALFLDFLIQGDGWTWLAFVCLALPVSLLGIVVTSALAMALVGTSVPEWLGTSIVLATWLGLIGTQTWLADRLLRWWCAAASMGTNEGEG